MLKTKLIGRKIQRFFHIPTPRTHAYATPLSAFSTTVVHVLTIDAPPLTHHNHPKSVVYITIHSYIVQSVSLDKCIMTHIHHCSIIHSVFFIVFSLP